MDKGGTGWKKGNIVQDHDSFFDFVFVDKFGVFPYGMEGNIILGRFTVGKPLAFYDNRIMHIARKGQSREGKAIYYRIAFENIILHIRIVLFVPHYAFSTQCFATIPRIGSSKPL